MAVQETNLPEAGHLTSRIELQCRTGGRHARITAPRSPHCLGLSASPGKGINFTCSFACHASEAKFELTGQPDDPEGR